MTRRRRVLARHAPALDPRALEPPRPERRPRGLRRDLRRPRAHPRPLGDWLLWRYLDYWLCAAVVALACVGAGERVVLGLCGRIRGLHGHLFVSFVVGLLLLGLLLFAAGILQLYGTACFYAAPALLLAFGAPRLVALYGLLRRLRRLARPRARGPWPLAILGFGLIAWLMIYAGVMTPENVMFDSEWKHVASAESYAAHGGIFRYGQGYMFGARPQLATYLYTWAFLLPGGLLFDKITLCGHLEFMIFAVTTLVGIPAMVRRLIPGPDPSLVWAARFLFPGVFLYDSNLSIGADHIAAAFAIPIFLVTQELLRRAFRLREAALLGLLAAGVVLTKETAAVILLPPTALALTIGAIQQAWRRRRGPGALFERQRWIAAAAVIIGVGVVVSAPLWLKNLLWYGDPLYPNLYKVFDGRPWSADSSYLLEWGFFDYQWRGWHQGEGGLLDTLRVLFTWSFEPHDWAHFHGRRPVVGSLLTLLLPCLLLLPRTRKLWIVALWIHVGIAAWFQALPQDRYLQVLMPWMAALTAAILIHAWRCRVRVAIAVLVAVQIAWGGDVYFLSRNMLPRVVELFAASNDPVALSRRLVTQEHHAEVGRGLPPGSRILIHEKHPRLGTGAVTLGDWQTYQFGLSYGLMGSPRELWEAYKALGVTHLYWVEHRSRAWDSVAGDLMFFDMALRLAEAPRQVDNAWIAELPGAPPEGADTFDDRVLVAGCERGYASGEYRIADLRVPTFGPAATEFPRPRVPFESAIAAIRRAREYRYVVADPECLPHPGAWLPRTFQLAAKREDVPRLTDEPPHYPHPRPPPRGGAPGGGPPPPTRTRIAGRFRPAIPRRGPARGSPSPTGTRIAGRRRPAIPRRGPPSPTGTTIAGLCRRSRPGSARNPGEVDMPRPRGRAHARPRDRSGCQARRDPG
ncbi:MAG: hypothetical protein R3B09_33130 [Nannocystaceae bacterium]